MTDQQAATNADLDELAALPPVERAKAITELRGPRGNLPPALAEMRVLALLEARRVEGRKVSWLARAIGLDSASGVSRLTSPKHPILKRLAAKEATS